MFYYFGRKGRLAPKYPAPAYPVVVEPFAGSMGYTLHHQPTAAVGIESNPEVHAAWVKVCSMTPAELASYPEPDVGSRVRDRWSMMAAGSHGTAVADSYLWTDRMSRDLAKQKRMAARSVEYASLFIDYRLGDYTEAPDIAATWFVDPPYQNVARGYGRRTIDYTELGDWCRSRLGQVIVCEQEGADWLPFHPLAEIKGTTNKRSVEVYWLNDEARDLEGVHRV